MERKGMTNARIRLDLKPVQRNAQLGIHAYAAISMTFYTCFHMLRHVIVTCQVAQPLTKTTYLPEVANALYSPFLLLFCGEMHPPQFAPDSLNECCDREPGQQDADEICSREAGCRTWRLERKRGALLMKIVGFWYERLDLLGSLQSPRRANTMQRSILETNRS